MPGNLYIRSILSKLRLSDHDLTIEKGRVAKIPRADRTCPICKEGVEDEVHFIFHCPNYNDLRTKFKMFYQGSAAYHSSINTLKAVFNDPEGVNELGSFIESAFKKRASLSN